MLLSDFISEGSRALECIYPSEEARSLVLRLCEDSLGVRSYTHIMEPLTEIDPSRLPGLQSALSRLRSGEPLQYVQGYADFCGLRFNVTLDVLIPRPETEDLVLSALERISALGRPARVLDLCTGSGCIAWAVAALSPGTEVVAVDISPAALEVARSQSVDVRGIVPPRFVEADVLSAEQDFDFGFFDVVLSNPPYIMESEKCAMRRNVLEHEPSLALFVPDNDPLRFYRSVARWSGRCLKPGGWGMVEINETLGTPTAAVFEEAGFAQVLQKADFFGKIRFVSFEKSAL